MQKSELKMYKRVGFYLLKYRIGMGSFSQVYLAYDIRNLKKVAIKVMNSDTIAKNKELKKGVENEIKALNMVKGSPHIIGLLDTFRSSRHHYFVYELCEDGTLQQLIKSKGSLSEAEALEYFRQILIGYLTLYNHNIVHRDLKPDNILLKKNKVQIADFGLCQVLQSKQDSMEAMMGTLRYQAPELIRGGSYSSKCDIYSLGIVLYKMLYGKCPFLHNCQIESLQDMETQKLLFPEPCSVSQKTKNQIIKMLEMKEADRCDWKQVFDHFLYSNEDEGEKSGQGNWPDGNSFNNQGSGVSTEATETTDQSMIKMELFCIDKALKMHEQILNIADILAVASLRFPSSEFGKIAKVCSDRIRREMQSLISSISDSAEYNEIIEILKDNLEMIENLSRLHFREQKIKPYGDLKDSLKPMLIKFVSRILNQVQSLRSRQDMVIAAALIDIDKKRFILCKKVYESLSDGELKRRLENYS